MAPTVSRTLRPQEVDLFVSRTTTRVPIAAWLHDDGYEFTSRAMDEAAKNGNLDVLWLHDSHRSEGCTTQAMDDAARGE
uniref:Uncharacterized protein n=1 Tax=Globisporangium ultimum (strain ATCC 200006 / CBS 805.95 / DAOM BR144) TaxID=431595 RepID=K3X776_GLOUD